MASENVPKKDGFFNEWVQNYASVATANATLLNMTTGQAAALTTLSNGFGSAYSDSQAAKITAKSKVAAKDSYRKVTETAFRSSAKVVAANGNISNELKVELGLKVTPTPSAPLSPPTMLVATGVANGDNKLVWKRNGNATNTMFIIEVQYGESTSWQYVASTNKTKYTQTGQTPGLRATYRVIAQRDDLKSSPSNLSVVYGTLETVVLELKKAS